MAEDNGGPADLDLVPIDQFLSKKITNKIVTQLQVNLSLLVSQSVIVMSQTLTFEGRIRGGI